MKAKRKLVFAIGIILIAVLFIGLLWLRSGWLDFWESVIDYADLPGPTTFQMVFHNPQPEGISELAAVGYGFGQGHIIWMRFRLPPKTLNDLMGKVAGKRLTKEEFTKFAKIPTEDKMWREHAPKVSWDKIPLIKHPMFYGFNSTKAGDGWFGVIAVDPANNNVYVYAVNL
jgi:hypothetical protein